MKATKEDIQEIMREMADQSHRIVFGTAPERPCRRAVNPTHTYPRNIVKSKRYETRKTN
jgi:hypothetical protein